MVWQVISCNLGGHGGRGTDEQVEFLIKWWRFIKENVPACKDVRVFRHVLGPNRWHYQIWLQFDGIEGWEGVAAVQGPLPWTVADPRYPPLRSKVDQIDHQDEVLEEIPLTTVGR